MEARWDFPMGVGFEIGQGSLKSWACPANKGVLTGDGGWRALGCGLGFPMCSTSHILKGPEWAPGVDFR